MLLFLVIGGHKNDRQETIGRLELEESLPGGADTENVGPSEHN